MQIIENVNNGSIEIEDFDVCRINPNSYNLRLSDTLMYYTMPVLNPYTENETKSIIIPDEGFILEPHKLYLGSTMEYTATDEFIPGIEGRSSLARLGLFVHITAGFGDIGFKGRWTLEFMALKPIRLYKGMEICQIYYEEICGDKSILYNGKYQLSNNVTASKMYKETIDW